MTANEEQKFIDELMVPLSAAQAVVASLQKTLDVASAAKAEKIGSSLKKIMTIIDQQKTDK